MRRLCFLLPRTDYTIDDVWHVIGLRGTGSNDIVVENAFVPEHRTHAYTSGSVTSDSPIYQLPFALGVHLRHHRTRCSAQPRARSTSTSPGPPNESGSREGPGSPRSRSRRPGSPRRPASWTARGYRCWRDLDDMIASRPRR